MSLTRIPITYFGALLLATACGGADAGTGTAFEEEDNADGISSNDEDQASTSDSESSADDERLPTAADEPDGADESDPAPDEPAEVADTEPPSVISSTPSNVEAGIHDDAVIQIEFSEPMDPESVEAAYESVELSAEQVSFSWNEDNTVLTVTPNEALPYAEGNDPETIEALSFAIALDTTATDIAGNALEEDFALSFSTLRDIGTTFDCVSELCGNVSSNGITTGTSLKAGDTGSDVAYRTLFSFDLSAIPEEGVEVVYALVGARQVGTSDDPFVGLSFTEDNAELLLFDMHYPSRKAAASVELVLDLGVFSADPEPGGRELEVTSRIVEDLENRVDLGNLSQYALQFGKLSDEDGVPDTVDFAASSLWVEYLVP